MSSFWKNKNVRYFSEENKDPKKEDNKEKDTKKKEKVEDEPEVDEEKKEKSQWEEFTSFFGNKDKESSDKSKKEDNKGSFFSGGPELDNNVKLGMILLQGGLVFLVVQTDSAREFLGDYKKVTYSELRELIVTSEVERIRVKRISEGFDLHNKAYITLVGGSVRVLELGNVDHFLESIETLQVGRSNSSSGVIPLEFEYKRDGLRTLEKAASIASAIVFIGQFVNMLRTFKGMKNMGGIGDAMDFRKSNAKVFEVETNVKVKFKDVAGLDQAKLEITEFVDFLKNPGRYKDLGAKIPRGALLAGPPGTGKTMLAKACAGEAGVTFLYSSGSEFVEMFVGVGASRVRDLFKQAKQKAPSIIFIDEIDAIGKKRAEGSQGGNDERDSTLNQLLVELDGFGTDVEVVVFAATNRKELLDPALVRTGRFDRAVDITLPDIEARKDIFKVHLAPLKLSEERTIDRYAKRLATLTPGFSGADISNICNEAAIVAARKNKLAVEPKDFEEAVERVIGGLEQKRIVSDEERRTVAVHESGHAIMGWFLEGGAPLLKLTIIPRSKGSLGFAQYLPSENSLQTKEELLDQLCCILGGRCAEEEFFGKITTGAYDDLEKAFKIAHNLVTKVGMSEKIGYVNYSENEYGMKIYSDQTNRQIDEEVKRIIDECTEITRTTVKKHRKDIENLSDKQQEKETVDLTEITAILGKRPFEPKSTFKAYLEEINNENEDGNDQNNTPGNNQSNNSNPDLKLDSSVN